MFKAISFDLDETLSDGSHFKAATVETSRLVAERVADLSASQVLEANGRAFTSQLGTTFADWALGKITGHELTFSIWQESFASLGRPDDKLAQFATETHTDLAKKSYALFADVLPVLSELKRIGVPTALVTNGSSDTQREKIDILNLEPHLDVIVVSAEHGYAKPNREIFSPVIDAVGLDPHEIWHVGDLMHMDVLGAENAGLHSVWLNRNSTEPTHAINPKLTITSLNELLKNPGA